MPARRRPQAAPSRPVGSARCRRRARSCPRRRRARTRPPARTASDPGSGGAPSPLVSPRRAGLFQIDSWDVPFAAAGVTRADGVVATHGDARRAVRLASVSKPVTALAVLVAAEEGVVDLDEPAGPPGSTCVTCSRTRPASRSRGRPARPARPAADLLERGLPGPRRSSGARAEMPFAEYVRAAVCEPLGLRLDPGGHPGARGCTRISRTSSRSGASCSPRRSWRAETHDEMVAVQFPGSTACCPSSAASRPLDWGLGVELKGDKSPPLVGLAHVAADVRSLRRQRHVRLGRPRGRDRLRRADDEGVRGVGKGRLVTPLGRGARRDGRLTRPRLPLSYSSSGW